jgi:hypothetical protein
VFGPDINLPKLNGWLDALNKQPMMEFEVRELRRLQ